MGLDRVRNWGQGGEMGRGLLHLSKSFSPTMKLAGPELPDRNHDETWECCAETRGPGEGAFVDVV